MLRRVLSLCVLLLVTSMTLAAQHGPDSVVPFEAVAAADAVLHSAPDPASGFAGEVTAGAELRVTGRDESALWVAVEAGEVAGWLAAAWLDTGGAALDLWALPLTETRFAETAPSPSVTMLAAAEAAGLALSDADRAHIARLMAVPVLHNLEADALAALLPVAESGAAQGRRGDVFTRVGDSDTTSGDFLRPMGMRGDFCAFGPYAYLEAAVAHFDGAPRDAFRNPFDATSVAAVNGLTMNAALDPFWTQDPACLPNETPLACEYRLARPSVAVIMLGRMDVTYFDADFYAQTARLLVEASVDAGVIPVLTTFVVLPDHPDFGASLAFNSVLLDLADAYGLPLIHLWRAVQTLPRHGIGPDLTHLSHAVGEFCSFDGAQFSYGGTLRNLLTLLALDALRRGPLAAYTES